MKSKVHKLTLNISQPLMEKLNRYKVRMGINYSEAFKCFILGIPEDEDIDTEAELSTLIGKLTRRLEATRRKERGETQG